MLATAAVAIVLAVGVTGRGCAARDDSPEGAVRAFVGASRGGDRGGVWELLGPQTRARLGDAAERASEKVGGSRRFEPLDMLHVGVSEAVDAPVNVLVREHHDVTALVDVLGTGGRRDTLTTVRVDGHWRVELSFD